MKKLMYAFVLFCTFNLMGQEQKEIGETIKVNGHTEIKREINGYRIRVTLNMDQVYYSEPTITTFESLKNKYFKAVREAGLDPSKFTEFPKEFLSLGYQKDGTILQYDTSSEEELEKLSKVKMTGVALGYQFKSVLDSKQKEIFLKRVLENARQNAEEICNAAGKKPGDIISISGDTPKTEVWDSYLHSGNPEYWTLTVTYSME